MASAQRARSVSPDDAYGDAPPTNDDVESRGSSVSSRLQDEYDNVLKSAVLMPNVENIPAIVEQFLGSVAREVDTYPAGHAFSSARLVDVSDDENPRPSKPTQSAFSASQRPGSSIADAHSGIIDVMGKELSDSPSVCSGDVVDRSKPLSTSEAKSESKLYFSSMPQINASDVTSSESDTMFRQGALPRSRFIAEKPQPVVERQSPKKQAKSGHFGKPKAPLLYTAPQRTGNGCQDASGASLLDQLATADGDLARTENLLDQWSGELKRNIMAEFGQSKCRIAANYHLLLNKEKERHLSETRQLREEMDSVRELLATYETSLSRKDQVISNLTQSLHRHRDRLDMQRRFAEWRQQHADKKREAFCSKLAAQHYERSLYRLIWNAWHSLLVGKWRHRVERACQAKAQEVCLQLTNDYEAKIASVNEALEASRNEVTRLQREREWYEENMKKAFMRGVCALNMEALGMFRPPENDREIDETADLNSEAEAASANQMPVMPFFAPMPTGGAGGPGLSSTAPVYTVTRESALSCTQSTLPSKQHVPARKSGGENVQPQKVIRAQMIARDTGRDKGTASPLAGRSAEPAALRRTVPLSPSCKSSHVREDPKRVHFSHTQPKN